MLNGMHGSLLEKPRSFVSLQWKRFAEMSIPKSREKYVLNLVPAKAGIRSSQNMTIEWRAEKPL